VIIRPIRQICGKTKQTLRLRALASKEVNSEIVLCYAKFPKIETLQKPIPKKTATKSKNSLLRRQNILRY
jgi:hypothetical protein